MHVHLPPRIDGLVRLALGAALVGACSAGGAQPSPSSDRISHPTGPAELVLRISTGGGFVPPSFLVTQVPQVSLYGDGTVITQGAQTAIFPGPAMPGLLQARVTEAGIQRILRAAASAGLLGPDRHFDYQGVADAPTTTFTVNAAGGIHTVSAYALGMGPMGDTDPNMPVDERLARGRLAAFVEDLSDLRGRLGADEVGPDQPYVAKAVRVFVSPGDPAAADDPKLVKVVDWPLQPGLAAFGAEWNRMQMRCGVLEGADLDKVRSDFTSATQLTFWRSEGQTYRLDLRPLLPDEQGCPQPS